MAPGAMTATEAKMFAYDAVKTTTEKMQGELDAAARGRDWELFQATHVGGRDWVLIWRFTEPEADTQSTSDASDAEVKRLRYRLNRVETVIDTFVGSVDIMDNRVFEMVCAALGRPEGKYWKTRPGARPTD